MLKLFEALYKLTVQESNKMGSNSGTTAGGHVFEDLVSQTVYQVSKQIGIKSAPARNTLDLPTFSGIKHQFDSVFSQGNITYVVECKRIKVSTKHQIYYFNATIIDYILGIRLQQKNSIVKGLFVSTAPVEHDYLVYAFGYAITVIDPAHPPIDYVIATATDGNVRDALLFLKEKMASENALNFDILKRRSSPESLAKEYEYLVERWKKMTV